MGYSKLDGRQRLQLIFFFFNFILFLNFTNCISFAKYQNESATVQLIFFSFDPMSWNWPQVTDKLPGNSLSQAR